MKSFTIYEEYFDLITILPKEEEQKDLLYKIAEYMFYDKEPTLNKNQTKIFNNLKRPLDKSKTKSKATSNQNQNEIKTKSKTNQNKNTSNDVNVNVNVNVFKKPKLEEVKAYCIERNNNVDAETFMNFYESKGWMVGKNKMKDWKACVRTWEKAKKTKVVHQEKPLPNWFNEVGDIIKPDEDTERQMKELLEV